MDTHFSSGIFIHNRDIKNVLRVAAWRKIPVAILRCHCVQGLFGIYLAGHSPPCDVGSVTSMLSGIKRE